MLFCFTLQSAFLFLLDTAVAFCLVSDYNTMLFEYDVSETRFVSVLGIEGYSIGKNWAHDPFCPAHPVNGRRAVHLLAECCTVLRLDTKSCISFGQVCGHLCFLRDKRRKFRHGRTAVEILGKS